MRLLVIEDDRDAADYLVKAFREVGYVADLASDGEEGFTKAKALKPALILLDVVMPRSDGFATCRKLKRDPETAAIPVLMVSSKGGDSDRVWAQRQGASGYVTKPFTPEALKSAFGSFI